MKRLSRSVPSFALAALAVGVTACQPAADAASNASMLSASDPFVGLTGTPIAEVSNDYYELRRADSNHILARRFHSYEVISLSDGTRRTVTPEGEWSRAFRMSPDGKWLAAVLPDHYSSDEDPYGPIKVVSLTENRPPVQVAVGHVADAFFFGGNVIITSPGKATAFDPTTGSTKWTARFDFETPRLRTSPDGKLLFMTASASQAKFVDLNGVVTTIEGLPRDCCLTYSNFTFLPDSKSVIALFPSRPGHPNKELWQLQPNLTAVKLEENIYGSELPLSADGSKVLLRVITGVALFGFNFWFEEKNLRDGTVRRPTAEQLRGRGIDDDDLPGFVGDGAWIPSRRPALFPSSYTVDAAPTEIVPLGIAIPDAHWSSRQRPVTLGPAGDFVFLARDPSVAPEAWNKMRAKAYVRHADGSTKDLGFESGNAAESDPGIFEIEPGNARRRAAVIEDRANYTKWLVSLTNHQRCIQLTTEHDHSPSDLEWFSDVLTYRGQDSSLYAVTTDGRFSSVLTQEAASNVLRLGDRSLAVVVGNKLVRFDFPAYSPSDAEPGMTEACGQVH